MADYTNDSYYQLSLNILKALGGDTSISFPDADAIWEEIYKIYDHAGGRFDIVSLQAKITENGQYDYYPENDADAFMPVNITVDVPQKYTDEQVGELINDAHQSGLDAGFSQGYGDGLAMGRSEGFSDGYSAGEKDGIAFQKAKLSEIQITENGIYTREDGYKTVTVEIEGGISEEEVEAIRTESFNEGYAAGESDGYSDGYSEGLDDGAEDQKALLTTIKITENGVYEKEDGYKTVTVEVAGSGGAGLDWSGTNYNETDIRICNGFIEDDIEQLASFKVPTNSSWQNQFKYSDIRYLPSTVVNSNVTNIKDMFVYSPLVYVPHFNANNATATKGSYGLFGYNTSLRKVGRLLFPKVTDLSYCFYVCYNLESIDSITTSEALTNTSYMFGMYVSGLNTDYTSKLTSVPLFDTSNVTNMSYMFNYCKSLTTIPQFNTSKVTNMSYMFMGCEKLVSVPELDCSSVTNMNYMFGDCYKLQSINLLNTGNVTNMYTMCQNTNALTTICELDCSSVQKIGSFFGGSISNINTIKNLGGFKNLGQYSSLTGTNDNYFLSRCPNLTKESILNILNGLYDRASAGMSVLTLKMNANSLALLSNEEKAIATNKGWTLS